MDFLNKVIDLNLKFSIKMKIIAPVVLLVISSLIILKTSNIEKSYLFESQLKWALLGVHRKASNIGTWDESGRYPLI